MAKVVRGVDSYKKEFLSIFNSLCGRHGRWEVWSDFIQLTAIDISNVTDKANAPKRAAGDPERIWFTPLFSDGIWYGRRLAAQMDLLISGSSRKSPESVNSFTEKPEKVADLPAKDTKKPCSFTGPAKAAAPVSTPVSTKKVETWKPAELNETKNGQLTFF